MISLKSRLNFVLDCWSLVEGKENYFLNTFKLRSQSCVCFLSLYESFKQS